MKSRLVTLVFFVIALATAVLTNIYTGWRITPIVGMCVMVAGVLIANWAADRLVKATGKPLNTVHDAVEMSRFMREHRIYRATISLVAFAMIVTAFFLVFGDY